MAFLYKHGFFPTLNIGDMSNVMLISAKPTANTYAMYLMIGEDVVLQAEEEERGSLFERFCITVEEEVARVMEERREKGCDEKEGWMLEA